MRGVTVTLNGLVLANFKMSQILKLRAFGRTSDSFLLSNVQ